MIRLPKLFSAKSSQLPFDSFAEYYIGADVVASGDCKTDQDIYIDGQFEGSLHTSGLIELAKNSRVNAKLIARTAIFEGSYEGQAKVDDELHIASCATVSGSLETINVIIDKGAIVNASIKMERQ